MKITAKKAIIIVVILIAAGVLLRMAMLLSEVQSYASSPNAPGVAVVMPGVDTAKFPYDLLIIGVLVVAALAVILYTKLGKK